MAPVHETLTVPTQGAAGAQGATSQSTLVAGVTYLITATGTFTYDTSSIGIAGTSAGSGGLADATCENLPPDPTFQRDRFFPLSLGLSGHLDHLTTLYVNGQSVSWQAQQATTALGCSPTHTYQLTFTPTSSGSVSFRIEQNGYEFNSGNLNVEIDFPPETLLETVTVPTSTPAGVTTTTVFQPGVTYRLAVGGTYVYNTSNPSANYADTNGCIGNQGQPFAPQPYQPVFGTSDPTGHLLALYLNGAYPGWSPASTGSQQCDLNHAYTLMFAPQSAGTVNFAINDTYYPDNSGTLTVQVLQEGPSSPSGSLPGVPAVTPPTVNASQSVSVPATNNMGAVDPVPVVPGQAYLLTVTGTYGYTPTLSADAVCSVTAASSTYQLSSANYPASQGWPTGILQLIVNGQPAGWQPGGAASNGCSTTHSYSVAYVPTQPILRFQIIDTIYYDNSGELTVTVQHLKETQVGSAQVDSRSSSGSTLGPVVIGYTYRVQVSGAYEYWASFSPNYLADAACDANPSMIPPGYVYDRYFASTGHHWHTALLDGHFPGWTAAALPLTGASAGCDGNNQYTVTFTATSTHLVNLTVLQQDAGAYSLDSGVLQATLFLETS